jgi:hypothetical protein
MMDTNNMIRNRLGGNVEVLSIPPILLGGFEDAFLTRSVFETAMWLKAVKGYPS